MIKKITDYCKRYVYEDKSPARLALSFCIGNYIAFSPFLFLHTLMVFGAVWLWQLNFPVTLAAACINNPWTMVPVYMLDYVFGYWLLHSVMHIGSLSNPSLLHYVDYFCEHTLGLTTPCFWSFLLGGNLLGIITSIILYPIMKKLFAKLILQVHGVAYLDPQKTPDLSSEINGSPFFFRGPRNHGL